MSFPSLFSLIFARSPLRQRRAWASWCMACVFALLGLLGSGMAQAATHSFNGGDVNGCSRTDREYTCGDSPYKTDTDQVEIASGYTVRVNNNVTTSWNQGLTMSGTARLVVSASLSLSRLNPANLKVSGGAFQVGGTFSMGSAAQSMTANVTAGEIQLGSAKVTINGSLTSTGLVSISSGSTITGNISGTVVTTSSPVTITGNVSATSRFTLASGSTLVGDIVAPVFDMLPSNSRVEGNITAVTSMTMGSSNVVDGNISTGTFVMAPSGTRVEGDVVATTSMKMGSGTRVEGNVDTGDLLLESSSALITGDAKVNWATLEWAGRVAGTIFCKKGTGKNKCDCVTNNSGFPVNSVNGPRCEADAPAGPQRFQITHDGEGDTCLEEKITVTACANAACTAPHYAGEVSGTLMPFGANFTIPANTGAQVVSVKRFSEGAVTLALNGMSVAAPTACYRTSNNDASCGMTFTGGVKLAITVDDHAAAATGIKAKIEALTTNASKTACVAAFGNKTLDVQYSCSYSKPKTGSAKLTLGGTALSCGAASPSTISTTFNDKGIATPALSYPDAGEIKLAASADYEKGLTAKGEGSFIAVPASFGIAASTGPIRAGADFPVTITALNSAGATTPNFDSAKLKAAGATAYDVALDIACRAQAGAQGLFFATTPGFADGVGRANARWSEVGKIDLSATLSGFLGVSGLGATGSTNVAGAGKCSGKVGQFIPQYFKVTIERPADEAARGYHYSREPFVLAVTAMNQAGQATLNYEAALGYSEQLSLSAVDNSGTAFAPSAPGALSVTSIPAMDFKQGRATASPAYAFAALRTAPRTIRLRAANGKAAPHDVTSAYTATPDPDAAKEATTSIRSGRLRLVNRFGSARGELKMPVIAEIWSGNSWLQHTDDVYTVVPAKSFPIVSRKQSAAQNSVVPFAVTASNADVKLANGIGSLALTASTGGPGWGDVTANLGGKTAGDRACASLVPGATMPASTGAELAWLRSFNTCTKTGINDSGNYTDPSARATFGVFEPETKRIIHVREAFN